MPTAVSVVQSHTGKIRISDEREVSIREGKLEAQFLRFGNSQEKSEINRREALANPGALTRSGSITTENGFAEV